MKEDEIAIKVEGLSKSFKLPNDKKSSIKSLVTNFGKSNKGYSNYKALDDINFEVKRGEFFGIVGRNGSGKSTLLKLLAGIYTPDKGKITINGKLTPFIELGVGFNPELTGRENVFLNGALLGFSRKEMIALYDEIVEFAELEKFMDQKLKNYSSGMQVRLAFSIAIKAQSDILILDEVLAVGDALFQQKCLEYFKKLKSDGHTVILVSHDIGTVQQYCARGVLINDGKMIKYGPIDKVVNCYSDILLKVDRKEVSPTKDKNGLHKVEIKNIKASKSLYIDNEEIAIKVVYLANDKVESPIYGITIKDSSGQLIFASNTKWYQMATSDLNKNKSVSVVWSIPNIFRTGSYTVDPAVANVSGNIIYDWQVGLAKFKVKKSIETMAVVNPAYGLTINE